MIALARLSRKSVQTPDERSAINAIASSTLARSNDMHHGVSPLVGQRRPDPVLMPNRDAQSAELTRGFSF
jgi:hypothetical protein